MGNQCRNESFAVVLVPVPDPGAMARLRRAFAIVLEAAEQAQTTPLGDTHPSVPEGQTSPKGDGS